MSEKVVVYDPTGEIPDGEVLEDNALKVFEARGGVALPVHVPLLGRNGVAGYVKRSYGRGIMFGMTANKRGCPVLLYAVKDCPVVHWAARLDAVADAVPDGRIRLVGDGTQVGAAIASGGVSSSAPTVEIAKLGEPDDGGGWIVRGQSRLVALSDGFVALGLYGAMTGVKVLWLAVSQSR